MHTQGRPSKEQQLDSKITEHKQYKQQPYFKSELAAITRLEILDTSLVLMTPTMAAQVLEYNF